MVRTTTITTTWCIDMLVAFLRNNLHLRYLSLVKAPSHECRLPESRESAMQRQSLVLHACQRARQPPDIVSRSALRETFLHRLFGAFCRCVPLKLGCVTPGFVRVLTAADWRVHHIASHNHDHGEKSYTTYTPSNTHNRFVRAFSFPCNCQERSQQLYLDAVAAAFCIFALVSVRVYVTIKYAQMVSTCCKSCVVLAKTIFAVVSLIPHVK